MRQRAAILRASAGSTVRSGPRLVSSIHTGDTGVERWTSLPAAATVAAPGGDGSVIPHRPPTVACKVPRALDMLRGSR